jgi:penicillin-binding protein 1A
MAVLRKHQCIEQSGQLQWFRPVRSAARRKAAERAARQNVLGMVWPMAHMRALPRGSRGTVIGRPLARRAVASRKRMVKLFRFLFVCAVLLAIAGCGFIGVTLWYFGRDLPDYQQLAHYQPPIMTRVHAGDGRLLAEYATERRVFVPIQAIPKPVIDAFLAAEDKNFYSHHGIDPISIVRAAITDVGRFRANRRPVGASTITQQVAKNMLLSSEISIERKIKEALLATRIEAVLPKDRILELYLNEIYLGAGAYGVAAAALTYFDKSLDELSLGEAAFLAGL